MTYSVMDDASLIRDARRDIGMTQAELAAAAGIDQGNLSKIERGERPIARDLARRLLAAARLRPSIALARGADHVRRLADRYGVRNVRVVGSVAQGTDDEHSDVDLLVGIDADTSSLALAAFQADAAALLGFPVDVIPDVEGSDLVDAMRATAVPV